MKKTVSKLFALLLASSVVLSGCNSSIGETSGEKQMAKAQQHKTNRQKANRMLNPLLMKLPIW